MKTGYTVIDAMTKNPITIEPHMSVADCAQLMHKHDIGSLLIQNENTIAGILTEEDIVRRIIASGKNPTETAAKDVMSRSVISISPDADIYDAMVKMRDGNIRHLPVTSESSIVGFLTMKDLLKIEPDLLDVIVENFELREEENKPINRDNIDVPNVFEEDYDPFSREKEQVLEEEEEY